MYGMSLIEWYLQPTFVTEQNFQTKTWSTLVDGGKERYQPPGKLTLEMVLANQNKINFYIYGLCSLPSGPVRFLTCSMTKIFKLISGDTSMITTSTPVSHMNNNNNSSNITSPVDAKDLNMTTFNSSSGDDTPSRSARRTVATRSKLGFRNWRIF